MCSLGSSTVILFSVVVLHCALQVNAEVRASANVLEDDTHSHQSVPSNWTVDFITKHGYPVETHQVTTEDGYMLTLHRIPSSPKEGAVNKGGHPILLHHGFLGCSADWVVLGPNHALGFVLADAGYDVWMTNARGSTNSKHHVDKNSSTRDFWDFSWHEIGFLDLPAEIDLILSVTGQSSLDYIGFSMGTTVFWVLGATRPEYIGKINKMVALAPVAFFTNVRNKFLKLLGRIVLNVDWFVSTFGKGEFLPTNKFLTWAAKTFCKDDAWSQALCKNVMFLISGFDSSNLNPSTVATIFEYAPAGGSTKEVLHFAQLTRAASTFQKYDYGRLANLRKYWSLKPPAYSFSDITCPVYLFVGTNDWVGNKKDAQTLAKHLPNVEMFKIVQRSNFNHVDFVFDDNAYELIYKDVLQILSS